MHCSRLPAVMCCMQAWKLHPCLTHTNNPMSCCAVLCRYLEKLPPRSTGALGTVQGGIISAVDVPELLLTVDGNEASMSGSDMGWVPALPVASELSLKKR